MTAPSSITEQFPPLPLHDLVEKIRRFDEFGWAKKEATICEVVSAHASINLTWGHGSRYRRARMVSGPSDVKRVDDVLWPPTERRRMARLNRAGEAMLYVSHGRDVCLSETRIKDDLAVLATFKIRPERTSQILPIGELYWVHRTGRGWFSGEDATPITGLINACPKEDAMSLIVADHFLAKLLNNKVGDYQLSNMVAQALFEKLDKLNAVAYQSQCCEGGMNLAVKAEGFWDDWGLEAVELSQMTHLACGIYQHRKIYEVTKINEVGEFTWSESDSESLTSTIFPNLWWPRD